MLALSGSNAEQEEEQTTEETKQGGLGVKVRSSSNLAALAVEGQNSGQHKEQ